VITPQAWTRWWSRNRGRGPTSKGKGGIASSISLLATGLNVTMRTFLPSAVACHQSMFLTPADGVFSSKPAAAALLLSSDETDGCSTVSQILLSLLCRQNQ